MYKMVTYIKWVELESAYMYFSKEKSFFPFIPRSALKTCKGEFPYSEWDAGNE